MRSRSQGRRRKAGAAAALPVPRRCGVLAQALGIAPRGMHVFVGAGGKTACIRRLLRERPHAVATTTTHLDRSGFDEGLLAVFPRVEHLQQDFESLWSTRPLTLAVQAGDRLRGPGMEWLESLGRRRAQTLLFIEADGAARRLIKLPASHEPAWPPGPVRRVVIVVGLAALGRPLASVAHHPERFGKATMVHMRQVERMVRAYVDAAPPKAALTILCTGVTSAMQPNVENLARRCAQWVRRRDPHLQDPSVALRLVAVDAVESGRPLVWHMPAGRVPSRRAVPAFPGVCGVLLAAGLGRRFRSTGMVESKLLVSWYGRPLLERAAEPFAQAGLAAWIAVTGHAAPSVETILRRVARRAGVSLRIVRNPAPERGLGSSVRLATRLAPRGMALLFGHGDMPSLSVATLRRVASLGSSLRHRIVAPELQGRPVHPVFFPVTLRRELRRLGDTQGGRAVMRAQQEHVFALPCVDARQFRDVDTSEDLRPTAGGRVEAAAHRVLFIGCGDLGSGAAHALVRAGFPVVLVELPQPKAVRRRVAFAEAARCGSVRVEGVPCRRVTLPWLQQVWRNEAHPSDASSVRENLPFVPLLVGSWRRAVQTLQPTVVVDARLAKSKLRGGVPSRVFHVALGPGHVAGIDCDVVVETLRGPDLGKVIWRGEAARDTGVPGELGGVTAERVLRAPVAGVLQESATIGARLRAGDVVARVGKRPVRTPIAGVLRGMLASGDHVRRGQKLGDVDPRRKPPAVSRISDKARRVGEGVLQAICIQLGLPLPPGGAAPAQRKSGLRPSRR